MYVHSDGCAGASEEPSRKGVGMAVIDSRPNALAALEGAMHTDDVLAAYTWSAGDCFRCATAKTCTTRVGDIDTPGGEHYEIRACGSCVLLMEEERRQWAQRQGLPYRPGGLGAS